MTELRRHIALEGSSNLRDIGGYQALDGREVRWGAVYRSGAMYRLTDADWQWMAERNIGAVCDLRSGAERVIAPTDWRGGDGTRHVGIAYEAELIFGPLVREEEQVGVGEMGNSLYLVFPKLLAPSFRMMFQALLDEHTPLIVHCTAGQDRTGLAIGLLLNALGVPWNTITEDYQLSTVLRRVENEFDRAAAAHMADSNVVARYYVEAMRKRGPVVFKPRPLINRKGEPLLTDAFAAIESQWGSIPDYLEQELGMGPTEIKRLRDIYLQEPGE